MSNTSGMVSLFRNNTGKEITVKWQYLLLLISIFTVLLYIPVSTFDFTNYDDDYMVVNNMLLRNLDWEGLKKIFSYHYPVCSNYHPLTTLSLAIDYYFVKLNPLWYHLENVLFHGLNTWLAGWFVYRLTSKNTFIALFVALFFGIHPMHTESVT